MWPTLVLFTTTLVEQWPTTQWSSHACGLWPTVTHGYLEQKELCLYYIVYQTSSLWCHTAFKKCSLAIESLCHLRQSSSVSKSVSTGSHVLFLLRLQHHARYSVSVLKPKICLRPHAVLSNWGTFVEACVWAKWRVTFGDLLKLVFTSSMYVIEILESDITIYKNVLCLIFCRAISTFL